MKWAYSDQSSIIRSAQKDVYYQQRLETLIEEQVIRRTKVKDPQRLSSSLARSIYLALTTGFGEKTLGEEYCSLLQVDQRQGSLPNPLKRFLLVIHPLLSLLAEEKWGKLFAAIGSIYSSFFYFGLVPSLHPVKLHEGLRYVYHPRRAPKVGQNKALTRLYTCLGAFSLLVGLSDIISALQRLHLQRHEKPNMGVENLRPDQVCTLCLAKRQTTSRLPCGHLFCWECVCRWLEHRKQCPLCRIPSSHADILVLYNI